MSKDPMRHLREQLRQSDRRRARRPQAAAPATTAISKSRSSWVMNHCSGVLATVEAAIQAIYGESGSFCDQHAIEAIQAVILGRERDLAGPQSRRCAEAIAEARKLVPPIDDGLWLDCLRTILNSAQLHQGATASPTAYLDFVAMMINSSRPSS